MKKKFNLLAVFTICIIATLQNAVAQTNKFPSTGAAGIGTTTPNASSLLDVTSTSKGVLVPRMTKTQRDAIATPTTGLLIYQINSTPGFYYYNGTGWTTVTTAKGWSLTGNAGTNPSNNFIGTTDSKPLIFKVSNQQAGKIDSSFQNTFFGFQSGIVDTAGLGGDSFFGFQSGKANKSGHYNSGFGTQALYSNQSGSDNTALGTNALITNKSGNFNTSIGAFSLFNNDGSYNTATGFYSLNSNTSGYANTANGYQSLKATDNGYQNSAFGNNTLQANTTGIANTAVGNEALYSNINGSGNVAIGIDALFNNTTANYNSAIGYYSLFTNTTGTSNIANGYKALFSNTTGYSNVALGSGALYNSSNAHNLVAVGDSALYHQAATFEGGEFPQPADNTGVGSKALYTNTTGHENTSLGYSSLYSNITGSYNSAVGFALSQNNSGGGNTAIGFGALNSNITGGENTAIGYNANVNSEGYSYSIALGAGSLITANNQVRIGSIGSTIDPTSIGGKVGWTTLSDGRVKKNIKTNVPGLAFINKLKPITYNLDLNVTDKIIQGPAIKDKEGKAIQPKQDESISSKAKEQIVYTGFVAQDVEKAAKELNYDFSGIDAAKNDKDLYGLRYAEFVVPLVKAVQELSKMNDEKDAKINELETRLSKLESALNVQQTAISSASLEQNIPNPFNHTTTINYTLPQQYSAAKIVIIDQTGKVLKEVNISGAGKGSINVDASVLASGAYHYSLIINGKIIASKQMVLAK